MKGFLLTIAGLLLPGCDREPSLPVPPPAGAPAAVMGAIVGGNVSWGDGLVRGDSAAVAAAYAPDAVLMTDFGEVTGAAAITAWLLKRRGAASDSLHATGTRTDQLDVAGDRAYEAGTITYTLVPRVAGPAREMTVRYVTFWRQAADGSWKVSRSLKPVP